MIARRKKRTRKMGRPDASFSARSQILMGAAQAFGEKGLPKTSVEDVLRAASVSRRTFYRFFRSKDQLFEELFEAASMIFLQSLRNAAALGKTPREKIENCVEAYLRAPQTAGPIFRVMQMEASRPGSKLAVRRQAVIEEIIKMLNEGVQQEDGRRLDRLLFRGLVAAMESIALHVHAETEGTESDIQRAKGVMLHILEASLSEDRPAPTRE